jgi:hypothetical protein
MPQRYNVDVEGLTGHVEFGDVWSYAELRQVDALNDADLMAFVGRKMIAVDLRTVDGDSVSTPEAFVEHWQAMDSRLFNWLLAISVQERGRIGSLGETILRASLKSYVETQATKATTVDTAK